MDLPMKYKLEVYKGIEIHLMQIAQNIGWLCNIKGKDYGSWITRGNAIEDDTNEIFEALLEIAHSNIEENI